MRYYPPSLREIYKNGKPGPRPFGKRKEYKNGKQPTILARSVNRELFYSGNSFRVSVYYNDGFDNRVYADAMASKTAKQTLVGKRRSKSRNTLYRVVVKPKAKKV